ncbi:zinc-binding metallopeptidase family protein [Mycolicibacterium tokaiense]|uniref:Uncharacterized protein conserved in bacteria (DUF2248) n=1 Tax=Mycolicibacterium tokaiense TaxID=39695 RepID=A0A378TE24_9MYCO|nr:putative zinc-binding metallopeptidase [Mycolicibacterium tokaiense]BBY87368.1 hypothetical protein MTOK_31500 [Mycolicibacterium tokaiense]STZ58125.1 Uncharacterized protein conserved in bacteria (DUF2248) [Mycolicibacterium tokaiense]
MRDLRCGRCGQHLTFENSICLSCGSRLGFSPEAGVLLAIPDAAGLPGEVVLAGQYSLCANLDVAGCNWLVALDSAGAGSLCRSCRLTRTRPNDADVSAMTQFASAERAKRRLIAELIELQLPIVGRDTDPEFGLAFDLLSSSVEPVTTGHENGVITLDLAEVDDVHRERVRTSMDEPYRTLLGHFRHETGHAYFHRLVGAWPAASAEFRGLFGDPDADYQAALDAHYTAGAGPWQEHHVSAYAAMHPAEDWAETFAHYLHIRDTLDTAAAFGLAPAAAGFDRRSSTFDDLIAMWLPLAWSLNMVNRSMGREDLYPFVLAPAVLRKMGFIHTRVTDVNNVTALTMAHEQGEHPGRELLSTSPLGSDQQI